MVSREYTIYTRFTEAPQIVGDIFTKAVSEKPYWSGRVITVLSAGWPLFFLNKGADACISFDRNPKQMSYLKDKYSHPETQELLSMLEQQTQFAEVDFLKLPQDYWQGQVFGDEVIHLSNIADHAESEGKLTDFVQQIINIIKSARNLTKMEVIISAIFPNRFGDIHTRLCEELAETNISCEMQVIDANNEPVKGGIKDFAVYTFTPC